MSMIGSFRRISAHELESLLQEPEGVAALLDPDDGTEEEDSDDRSLEIGKSWQMIHFLLAGDPWGGPQPYANAVCGGTELSNEDLGYGPARYLTPEQVAEVAAAISPISAEELWSRFDAQSANEAEIYPGHDWNETAETFQEYACYHYRKLQEFYGGGAKNGDAMILYLT